MAPDVDIETLRLLVAIEDLGSIGRAAGLAGISQPAASARVRAFEARWRLTVIHRSARGSRLTEDGAAAVAWARSVLHEVDTMRAGLEALSGARRSTITVAASLTVAEFLLPRWFGELHTRRPEIHPHLSVVNSETVAALVRTGDAVLGFVESTVIPTDLASRVIGGDRLAVVVRPDHPWARRRTPLARTDLIETEYVLREAGSGTRSTFESALRHEPRVVLEADSTTALVGAALASVGPAVVSSRAVAAYTETGRLVAVPTTLDLHRPLTAIWDAGRRLHETASDLLVIAAEASRRSAA